jgi:glutamate dehydrogenase (NADP+)
MSELYRHIGDNTDVPAGDIGVGGREIGYLFGQYKKLANRFDGTLTGKGVEWGGSFVRTEATGYGLVYLTEEMLKKKGDGMKGKTVVSSGSGNVSIYTAEKCHQLGAKVVAVSDSSGYVYDPEGIEVSIVKDIKEVHRGRIKEYAERSKSAEYHEGPEGIWGVKCDVAFPNATENELDKHGAKALIDNGVIAVGEGANMPTTPEGVKLFLENNVAFAPGKAANAGGVAVSGLEMAQNGMWARWTFEEADAKLKQIMHNILNQSWDASAKYCEEGNLVDGANIAGFMRVADAMIAQGLV